MRLQAILRLSRPASIAPFSARCLPRLGGALRLQSSQSTAVGLDTETLQRGERGVSSGGCHPAPAPPAPARWQRGERGPAAGRTPAATTPAYRPAEPRPALSIGCRAPNMQTRAADPVRPAAARRKRRAALPALLPPLDPVRGAASGCGARCPGCKEAQAAAGHPFHAAPEGGWQPSRNTQVYVCVCVYIIKK